MKAFLPALALLAMAAPVVAQDARVRSVLFEPDAVVRFAGKPGYQSAIRFGPDERIENVAVGDSMAWQVTPNKRGDHLFVKPLLPGARTNLTVVTDKRTYLFDLETPRGAQPVYALSFRYPVYPAPGAVAPPPKPKPAPVAVATAEPVKKKEPDPLTLNFGWVAKGSKALLPARTFDDGKSVYLSWPAKSDLPAILVAASDGTEGPVNYTVKEDYVVVAGTPRELILRRGKEKATVTASGRSQPIRTATAGDGQ